MAQNFPFLLKCPQMKYRFPQNEFKYNNNIITSLEYFMIYNESQQTPFEVQCCMLLDCDVNT